LADQLESISASADELLQATKATDEGFETQGAGPAEAGARDADSSTAVAGTEEYGAESGREAETVEEKRMAAKLSDYYGVSLLSDAVMFVTLYPRAQSVQVAGDFNSWKPEDGPMQKVGDSGVWQTKMKLPTGRYRYRLVVDGQWQQDPYNEWTELNPFGGYNSVLEVK
jgi:hypothetical protein